MSNQRVAFMRISGDDANQLLELWARANDKMLLMQEQDNCSVPAEFESLINFLGDLRSLALVQ